MFILKEEVSLLGYEWWQEGRNLNKKNGILDFTEAAEYLVEQGLTKPKKIGIMGTSHGGLITVAAMIEKPNLFGASYTNTSEFGSVKKKEEFMNLLSYSPFHNIKDTINYPASLIITASNDTRVPPYNSYKFAGKLQNGLVQMNPILLWTQDKAGHYGANRYNAIIEEETFTYSFLINELTKTEQIQ